MKCSLAQEWMSERLDGALEPGRLTRLEEHLASCPECQKEWRELAASWEMLGQLPELTPSPLFQARVWEKIRLSPPPAANPWPWFRRWLGGMVVAGACLALGVALWRPVASDGPGPGAPPATLAAHEDDLVPALDTLALVEEEEVLDPAVPLGTLSDDYLAYSDLALDETLEGL